jgi:hypothetical protein
MDVDLKLMKQNEWREIIEILFAHWNPFPDKAYCERMGWHVNSDGTVETPGGCFPTSDLCEVRELESLYLK